MSPLSHLGRYGERPALVVEDDSAVSYRELARLQDEVARGLKPRSLVFCLCSNTLESVAGYLACLRTGTVPLLLPATIDATLLEGLLRVYRPDALWAPGDRLLPLHAANEVLRVGRYALIDTGLAVSTPLHPDLSLLLTTSGSTGSPKVVRLSSANLHTNTESICNFLDIQDSDRPITTLPMHYTYGLSILQTHLSRGCTIVLNERSLNEREFWRRLAATGATSMGAVPYQYTMLNRLRFTDMHLPALKTLTQAGGKLNLELALKFARWCQETGRRFFMMYGQVEATARISYLPCEHAVAKAGSVGVAIPGGKLRIQDEAGCTVDGIGVEGELVYEGPNVSMGYAQNREDLSRGDDNKGVLRTGDLGHRDAEGFFHITGRRSRYVKIFGVRVGLDDVERLLASEGFECACTGEDDLLSVFTAPGGATDPIVRILSARMGLHASALRVRQLPSLPRNESGKLVYSALPQPGSS